VCPAEKLCESECYHLDYADGPTHIKKLQAWVCKKADAKGWDLSVAKNNDSKVAIVGAGPAGLSCAHFLVRLGYNVDIFEKESKIGGALTLLIPSFRLADDVVNRELKGILSYPNIDIKFGRELGKNVMVSDLSEEYDAVFIAPGLHSSRKLQLPGIDNINVVEALSLLREYKQNGKFDLAGKILVVGGGSVAADAASVALKCGASKVSMVCLESYDEMPCLKSEQDELKEEGVQIHNSWGPKEFSDNKLSCVRCESVLDNEGKFCPEYNDSKTTEIEFDTVIMAIGQEIESNLESYLEKEFGHGLIKVDEKSQLIEGQSNIYAGGDIVRGAGTVVASVADGRRAAIAIDTQLKK
jgi:NADPH-dependent glutamate synthase beta subunit-like oxidoreductase